MFRRSSSPSPADSPGTPLPEDEAALPKGVTPKKGKATPTRSEAQEAAKLRAKPPRTRKEAAAAARQANAQGRGTMARDKSAARTFIRDYVDVRFSFLEVLMPVMVLVLVLSLVAGDNRQLNSVVSTAMLFCVVLAVIDAVFLRMKLRRELTARFPDNTERGHTWYAISRAMQIRPLRLPKARKKIGQPLDEHYR